MASHDLEPGTKIKTQANKVLKVKQVNGPLVAVEYLKGTFAGVVSRRHITDVEVNGKWEEYTP